MIKIENLSKKYSLDNSEFSAVDNVSLEVKKGEIYGIIGFSGAGKSTLVRCINKLELPDNGKIIINGENILELNEKELNKHRKKISMIFQQFNLFEQKNVYKNISYPLEISNYTKDEIDEKVNEMLKFVDLESKKFEYPSNLSGGQKQRVAIARALISNPEILLSDESTSALDPANTKSILDLLKKAVDKYNLTIILITHQMEVAKEVCDRIAVMEKGKIIEENSVEELFLNPKHNVTKSFVRFLGDSQEKLENSKEISGKLLTLNFNNSVTNEPIVSKVIKTLNVEINIINGKINKLQDSSTGFLNIEIIGEKDEINKAINLFEQNKVIVEEQNV